MSSATDPTAGRDGVARGVTPGVEAAVGNAARAAAAGVAAAVEGDPGPDVAGAAPTPIAGRDAVTGELAR